MLLEKIEFVLKIFARSSKIFGSKDEKNHRLEY